MLGGDDADTVRNSGSNATIIAGAGNDLISLSSNAKNNFITFTAGDGNDKIIGFNATSSLKIGNGTTDPFSKAKVGSDMVVRFGDEFITLAGAATLKTLNILGTEVTALTDKNDFYNQTSARETILALRGDDTIQNGQTKFSPIDFDNLKINSYGASSVSIVGSAGNDVIINTGASLSVDGGDGSDTVRNYFGSHAVINGDADNDSVLNYYADYASISGGAGNDSIGNSGASVSLSGGDDKDSISNSGAAVTVDGGADADFLYNDGNTVSVFGGAGNDVVSLASSSKRALNTTVNAGLGNDTVYGNSLASVNYKYVKGDGKDVIYGFNTVSTLFIAGSSWTT